eukprot:6198981-Pleurochrysis_carterae.AAC.2
MLDGSRVLRCPLARLRDLARCAERLTKSAPDETLRDLSRLCRSTPSARLHLPTSNPPILPLRHTRPSAVSVYVTFDVSAIRRWTDHAERHHRRAPRTAPPSTPFQPPESTCERAAKPCLRLKDCGGSTCFPRRQA